MINPYRMLDGYYLNENFDNFHDKLDKAKDIINNIYLPKTATFTAENSIISADLNHEGENNMFDFGNMFHGMFKPVAKGYCKMGMNGQVAVKTSTGYKTFNTKTKKLTNCSNFAFDMDGAFWVVPTFKVAVGDIVLINGKPRCVIEVHTNSIKTFNYEDSTVEEVIPEHHVFMGKTYCYGKIFSPFMNMTKSDGVMNDMMKMMMMSQMFGGNTNTNGMTGMNPMMFMMMGKNNPFENMFDGAFDFGFGTAEPEEDKTEEEA